MSEAEQREPASEASVTDGTASSELECDRAWLAAIVDFSSDAILSKKLDGTITSWNAAAERMYGYPAAEVIGRSIEILVPADRRDGRAPWAWRARAAIGDGAPDPRRAAD
jgi:PAS domain-containing protein